ncbi:hypothetical protein ACLMAB_10515 [Brevibacillus laterosporus]
MIAFGLLIVAILKSDKKK